MLKDTIEKESQPAAIANRTSNAASNNTSTPVDHVKGLLKCCEKQVHAVSPLKNTFRTSERSENMGDPSLQCKGVRQKGRLFLEGGDLVIKIDGMPFYVVLGRALKQRIDGEPVDLRDGVGHTSVGTLLGPLNHPCQGG